MRYSFDEMLLIAEREAGGLDAPTRPTIVKEILHYSILHGLSRSSLVNRVSFMGGTNLRLVRGGQRYSEDLDFVAGADASEPFEIHDMEALIREHLLERFGLQMQVMHPDPKKDFDADGVTVKRWSFRIDVPGFQQKQRINIEVANVPTYHSDVVLIQPRYTFLSDMYADIAIRAESEHEVLADKVVAIVCRNRLKARDLWDLTWLKDRGHQIDFDLVRQKFVDYGAQDVAQLVQISRDRVTDAGTPAFFETEMVRFLTPTVARQLADERFVGRYIRNAESMLDQVEAELNLEPGSAPRA